MGLVWKVKLKETGQWHSQKEAAQIIGCNPKTLRKRRSLGRNKVKGYHLESWKREENPCWPVLASKCCRPVLCLETNQVFSSIALASRKAKVGASAISKCCQGLQDTAGDLHWEYVK